MANLSHENVIASHSYHAPVSQDDLITDIYAIYRWSVPFSHVLHAVIRIDITPVTC